MCFWEFRSLKLSKAILTELFVFFLLLSLLSTTGISFYLVLDRFFLSPQQVKDVLATTTYPVIIAQDSFLRANSTYWGTATDGQTWRGDANNNSIYSISNYTGQLTSNSSVRSYYSAVLGPVMRDAQVLLTGRINNYSKAPDLGAVIRWQDGNNFYKAYIDGSSLVIMIDVNGTKITPAATSFAAQAGIAYSLRFQVIGYTLSAKVWKAASPEPTNWMISTSNNTFSSGYCGLRDTLEQGTVVNYTSFTAYNLSSTPTVTPLPKPTSTPIPTVTPLPKLISTPIPIVATYTPQPKPTNTPIPTVVIISHFVPTSLFHFGYQRRYRCGDSFRGCR